MGFKNDSYDQMMKNQKVAAVPVKGAKSKANKKKRKEKAAAEEKKAKKKKEKKDKKTAVAPVEVTPAVEEVPEPEPEVVVEEPVAEPEVVSEPEVVVEEPAPAVEEVAPVVVEEVVEEPAPVVAAPVVEKKKKTKKGKAPVDSTTKQLFYMINNTSLDSKASMALIRILTEKYNISEWDNVCQKL